MSPLLMELFACGVVALILSLNVFFYLLEKFRRKKVPLRAAENIVVITGCDSGFGEMTSRALAKLGFKVVSACLTDEGMQRLKNVVTVVTKCDVTNEEDIAALAATTAEYSASSGCRLWGVVNNAGIGDGGNLDWTEMKVWRRVMEVNFFAVVAVSKAMLPMLKKTPESRIINISSLAGITSSPAMGAYCASKHAVEGFAKCVREELIYWSIHMSNINPGFMRTPILVNGPAAAKKSFESAPAEITSEYTTDWMEGQVETINKFSEDPALVVDAVIAALTDSHPTQWYFPGNAAKIMRFIPLVSSGLKDFLVLMTSSTSAQPTPEALKKYR